MINTPELHVQNKFIEPKSNLWQMWEWLKCLHETLSNLDVPRDKDIRQLYRLLGVFLLASLMLTACAPGANAVTNPYDSNNLPYDISACIDTGVPSVTRQERNADPVFRASTLEIFNETGLGTGGLVDVDGRLEVWTVLHVAIEGFSDCMYVRVPGTGVTGVLNVGQMRYLSQEVNVNGAADDIVAFPLFPSQEQVVRRAIGRGDIIPLRPFEGNMDEGDYVGLPNPVTGKVSFMELLDKARNELWFDPRQANHDAVCGGRSGTPALWWDGGKVTNQIVGLTEAIAIDSFAEYFTNCTNDEVMVIDSGWR